MIKTYRMNPMTMLLELDRMRTELTQEYNSTLPGETLVDGCLRVCAVEDVKNKLTEAIAELKKFI